MPGEQKQGTKGRRSLLLMLFGLPFLAFGIGFGYFKLWPEVSIWLSAVSWQQAQGELISHRLDSARTSKGGTTYEITARYRYQVAGVPYQSQRVGIHTGKDNIGSYHQQWSQLLDRVARAKQPLTVWYDPQDPARALLDRDMRWGLMSIQIMFSAVFGLIGLGVVLVGATKGIRMRGSQTDPVQDRATDTSGMELDFSSREPIAPDAAKGHGAIWVFALLWNLISYPACIGAWDKLQSIHNPEDYLILLVLLFPMVGLFLFWLAIKGSILHVRYGKSLLRLDPNPGQAGGQVGGDIELSTPLPLDAQCEVRLECLNSRETRNSKGQTSIATSVEWQDALTVRGRREAGKTRLQFLFDVPAGLPPSQAKSSNWYHWQVHVAADIPGLDLALDFEVPVLQGTGSSRIRIAGRERQQQLQRSQQLAQVLNVEQEGDTLYLHSDYGRELWGSFFGGLFGAIFFAVGVGISFADMGPGLIEIPIKLLFCSVFGLIGLVILLACFFTPTTRLDTAIDRQALHLRRLFLGRVVYRKSIELASVTRLEAHKNSSYGNGRRTQNWFQLRVHHAGGKQVIAESIPGRVLADEAMAFLRKNGGLP